MCELFAMSSLLPTTVDFSLELLARRGGAEGPHRDGWGVAFYEDNDVLLLREPGAASESALVRHIEQHGPPSELVISHIRLATFGEPALRNTQPFIRELGGRIHTFAHNGDLPAIMLSRRLAPEYFLPVGDTDSEIAFCNLLDRLQDLWRTAAGAIPALHERTRLIEAFAADLREMGSANFLYCDSDSLFVHADRRIPPDSAARVPGLYLLERSCGESVPDLSHAGIRLITVEQSLTLIASVPLTDEVWRPLARGELVIVKGGGTVPKPHDNGRSRLCESGRYTPM